MFIIYSKGVKYRVKISSFECQETAFGWPVSGLGPGVSSVAGAKRAKPKRTSEMRPQCRRPALSTAESHGVLEDGVTSNGVPRSTAPSGISNPEKKMSCGTQCPNPQSLSSGPLTQKQNGLRTAEAKRETKRMTAKEVTINVAESIRQVDRSRRIAKNCIN
uniref:BAALC binder of MAP3K1 and KLF4 n=1 Tax=Bos taurus TaxID=9913 RepID=A0AAA9RY91_BOVIN